MQLTDLEKLCGAAGVGNCREAAETAAQLLRPLVDTVDIRPDGSVTGYRRCGRPDAPVLLLEAHIDEVGFVVTNTDPAGFLKVDACGHADERVLEAQPVLVYTEDGPRPGVFCSTPPHLRKDGDPRPALADRGIDAGLHPGEQVPAGTFAGFAPHFETYNGQVCAKALDDRSGVYAVLCALEQTLGRPCAWDIAVLFASGEELGCRGAAPAAFAAAPQAAIAVDVSFAYVPGSQAHACGRMGGGVMVGVSPCLDKRLSDDMIWLARQKNIPYQCEVMGESTGTDADRITLTRGGVPCALLSIPLKYMHTPVEKTAVCDIQAVADLMAAYIEEGEMPV
ncbi:MAG: hypothetical protein IKI50_07535 [Clostridia bacterium]|nr:hypothetical protein [Clostridia bacterium]